jgi:ornithine cyclodeaminase
MLVLTADDVRRAVPMPEAIEAVAAAFAALSAGQAEAPLRTHLRVAEHDADTFVMPARLPADGGLGLKVVSVFPHNGPRSGLPTIHALVALLDPTSGAPLALLDGRFLTALRTGAASGAATRHMARADARVLALFGAGAQAYTQALAVCAARPIERLWICNRGRERAEQLRAALLAAEATLPTDIRLAASPAEALADADVVCCATSAASPLFADAQLRPGTHINGVGSYTPAMAEVPPETIRRARVVVDQRLAAWAEAGDLIQARAAGLIDERHVVAELGEVVLGRVAGRASPDEITFFKSVGNAVQDVAVAQRALTRARALGLGTVVDL